MTRTPRQASRAMNRCVSACRLFSATPALWRRQVLNISSQDRELNLTVLRIAIWLTCAGIWNAPRLGMVVDMQVRDVSRRPGW